MPYSVRAFGAAGDGIRNDSEAIEAAVAAAAADGGGAVYFPAGCYRTSEWIDVDSPRITLLGDGASLSLIMPLDGSNVGGIRVGASCGAEPVSHVTIRDLGYDGNAGGQNPAAKQLHGISLIHCTHVTIADCFLTRTAPYHEHNTGGSGITVERFCSYYSVAGCRIDDIGDRCIQTGGQHGVVRNNTLTNGFDRAVGFTMRSSEGLRGEQATDHWHLAEDLLIDGNIVDTFSATSAFGGSRPTNHADLPVDGGNTGIRITNNSCRNVTRTLVRMAELTGADGDLLMYGNLIEGDHDGLLFARAHAGFRGTLVVTGNVSVGARPEHTDYQPMLGTINVTGSAGSATITDNVIADAAGEASAIAVECLSTIRGNEIRDCRLSHAIRVVGRATAATVTENRVRGGRFMADVFTAESKDCVIERNLVFP